MDQSESVLLRLRVPSTQKTDKQTACESHLREAQVEHVGVELAQSSGEAVAAQIVSAELAEKTNSTERRLKMDAATSAKSTYR